MLTSDLVFCVLEDQSWRAECIACQCFMCLKIAIDQPQRCQYVMGRNPCFPKTPEWGWIKTIKRVLCPIQAMKLEIGKCYMTWLLIIWGSNNSRDSQETQRNWSAGGNGQFPLQAADYLRLVLDWHVCWTKAGLWTLPKSGTVPR